MSRRRPEIARRIAAAAVLALLATSWLPGQYQREPPDFSGTEYRIPTPTHPEPKAEWKHAVDAGLLALGLGLAAWMVLRRRSRGGMIALGLASIAYFGFWKRGCICAIGSIQNVALCLADPRYAVSLAVAAFFILPLVAAFLFGRVFCGAICPHGALQDLVLLRPVRVPRRLDRALGWLKWIYLAAAVWFAAVGLLPWMAKALGGVMGGRRFIICEWDPFVSLFRLSGSFRMLALGGAFVLLAMFVGRPYCRWLCPYGALLSLGSRVAWKSFRITPDKELDCGLCAEACPYGAIRDLRAERGPCLSCGRCFEYCPRDRHAKSAGKTLVQVEPLP